MRENVSEVINLPTTYQIIVIVGWHRKQPAWYAGFEARKSWEEYSSRSDSKSWCGGQQWLRFRAARVSVGCDKRVCDPTKGSQWDDKTAARHGDGSSLPDEADDSDVQFAEAANWSQKPSTSH